MLASNQPSPHTPTTCWQRFLWPCRFTFRFPFIAIALPFIRMPDMATVYSQTRRYQHKRLLKHLYLHLVNCFNHRELRVVSLRFFSLFWYPKEEAHFIFLPSHTFLTPAKEIPTVPHSSTWPSMEGCFKQNSCITALKKQRTAVEMSEMRQ